MTILKAPAEIREAFRVEAMKRHYMARFLGGQPACWLGVHDPLHRLCEGRWEAFHFLGRQEIRNHPAFFGLDPEIVMLMEWDARLGGPGCVGHHRRYDKHADAGPGSELIVLRLAVPGDVEEAIEDYGLEMLAERRFSPG